MGLLACRAGASRVYSIEVGGMISVAREVARANGFENKVVFIKGYSLHVDLPEKVDVVVADQIGNFGFNAGIIEYFADARRRFLKPEGTMLPLAMNLILAPVESPDIYAQVDFWNTSPAGFNFKPVRGMAANTGYQVNLDPGSICGDAATIASIDLSHAETGTLHGEATTTINRTAVMHGLGGWFSAQLAAGIWISNSPLSPAQIKRRQIFFPIDHGMAVNKGDLVKIRMAIRPVDMVVNWNVEIVDGVSSASKGRSRHSTWKGMLITEEDRRLTQPEFKPKLLPRGEGRRTVCNLCDGTRTLTEIEDEVFRRHPELFRSRDEVAVFVAEVVTRYSA